MSYFENENGQVLKGFAVKPTDSIAEFLAERFLRRRHQASHRQSPARSVLYGAVIGALTGACIPLFGGRINELLAQVANAMSHSPDPQAEPTTSWQDPMPSGMDYDMPWMGFLCCECGNTQTYKPIASNGGVTVAEAKAMGWTCKKGDDPEGFCGRWTCPVCNEAHASEPLRTRSEPESSSPQDPPIAPT
jgi:hypothetical protein